MCCTGGGEGGGNSQVDMGNFANGIEIANGAEGIVQEV